MRPHRRHANRAVDTLFRHQHQRQRARGDGKIIGLWADHARQVIAIGGLTFGIVDRARGTCAAVGHGGGHGGLQLLDRGKAAAVFRAGQLRVGFGQQARYRSLTCLGLDHRGGGRWGDIAHRALRTDRAHWTGGGILRDQLGLGLHFGQLAQQIGLGLGREGGIGCDCGGGWRSFRSHFCGGDRGAVGPTNTDDPRTGALDPI